MCVFALDRRKSPLMPCSQRRARLLLERGRAVVHRHHPFTIRLKDRVGGETQPVELRVDPGSKGTGSFNVQTPDGTVQGISHRHCRLLQRSDGYGYGYGRMKGSA
jgi:hypothetical protein